MWERGVLKKWGKTTEKVWNCFGGFYFRPPPPLPAIRPVFLLCLWSSVTCSVNLWGTAFFFCVICCSFQTVHKCLTLVSSVQLYMWLGVRKCPYLCWWALSLFANSTHVWNNILIIYWHDTIWRELMLPVTLHLAIKFLFPFKPGVILFLHHSLVSPSTLLQLMSAYMHASEDEENVTYCLWLLDYLNLWDGWTQIILENPKVFG